MHKSISERMSPANSLAGTLEKDSTSFKEVLHSRNLVAHTGFEPVISSLRGRCPRPLDECATLADHSEHISHFSRPDSTPRLCELLSKQYQP